MIAERVLKALEYDKILNLVSGFAQSENGKALVREIRPCMDFEKCKELLLETKEATRLLYDYNVNPSFNVDDVTESVRYAEKQSTLSIKELMQIATVLRISSEVKSAVTKNKTEMPILFSFGEDIYTADRLAEEIDDAVLNDEELRDSASPDLASIRSAIRRAGERLKEKILSIISNRTMASYLQDAIVTKRGDRYVIPVKNEYRSFVKGIVHDQSSSGQTVFIEPQEVVEMNNALKQLELDEAKEVERILRAFTAKVASISKEILKNLQVINALDVIFARAVFSRRIKASEPILNKKGYINIKSGRHPLIDKEKVVPVSVRLGKEYNLLLITGPNTGGKTVSLKLTGLFTLMGMSGFFIPAEEESELSFFDKVFCDVGDEQSIEQSLSTFSSHIKNVVETVNSVDENSLVLLDELGAGTDPEEGASLAVAITDFLRRKGVKCILTTHYSALKEYSYATEGVENASMDFDPETFEPLYKLIIGIPGTSNALEISRRIGLREDIISEARKGISKDRRSFEEVLQSADQTRRLAEEKRSEAEEKVLELESEISRYKTLQNKLENQIDRLNQNAKKEVKRLVDNALLEVNDILDELKKLLDEPTKGSYFEATKLRKKIENIHSVIENEENDLPKFSDEAPKAGDLVFVTSINSVATLETITKNGEYIVKVGNLKSIVRKNTIKKLLDQNYGKKKPQENKKPVKYVNPIQPLKNTMEINLLGKHVDEAVYMVDEFIADCKAHNLEFCRIIHGNGSGALRNGIWDYLSGADVVSYRLGGKDEGGSGATVVRLK